MTLSASDFIYLFFLGVCTLVAIVFLFYSVREKISLSWLSLANLSMCLYYVVLFLFRTKLILEFPHGFRLGAIVGLLYMPFSFLYIRTVITGKRPGKWDWLHGLPVFLFLIDFVPTIFSTDAHKLALIQKSTYDSAVFGFSEGWLLPGFVYQAIILIQPFAYWVAQLFYFSRILGKLRMLTRENYYWILWLSFYLMFQGLFFIFLLFIYISGNINYMLLISHVFAGIWSFFTTVSFFSHPQVVLGRGSLALPPRESDHEFSSLPSLFESTYRNGKHSEHSNAESPEHADHSKLGPLRSMTQKQIHAMKVEIDLLFERGQPFLTHSYSIQEMSNTLNFPLYQLSALINQEYGMNFNDLVNKQRVQYAIKLIKDGKGAQLNINGLANRCGFNNRNSFTAAFKKFTGFTPSKYFREI